MQIHTYINMSDASERNTREERRVKGKKRERERERERAERSGARGETSGRVPTESSMRHSSLDRECNGWLLAWVRFGSPTRDLCTQLLFRLIARIAGLKLFAIDRAGWATTADCARCFADAEFRKIACQIHATLACFEAMLTIARRRAVLGERNSLDATSSRTT